MKIQEQVSERGQAAVLLVLAMVVLLGFTALAVDGGTIYADRRFAQSGTDASSMAGGAAGAQAIDNVPIYNSTWSTNAACSSGNVASAAATARTMAVSQAADNDYTIGQTTPAGQGFVTTECGVETITAPKVGGGTFTLYSSNYMDVKTVITTTTQTAFAHFIFKDALVNSVTTVTRLRPRQPLAYGFAIVALNKSACQGNQNGVGFGGNLNLIVRGGGVFSNGCMDVDGHTTPKIYGGDAAYFFPGNSLGNFRFYDSAGNPIAMSPSRLMNDDAYRIPPEAYDVPVPDCTGHVVNGSDLVGRTNLSGLYCVDGAMSLNNSHESIAGTNVTLVFRGGKVTINGGTVNLIAPPSNYSGTAIPGVAIYLPKLYYGPSCGDVNQELKINGNANNVITGSILAPCSDVSLEGNDSTAAFNSQVIGYNVNSSGTANLNVVYNSDNQASRPTYIDLYR